MTRSEMLINIEWYLLSKGVYSLIDISAGGIIWIEGLEDWYNIGNIGTYFGESDSLIRIKKRILDLINDGVLL